jgi:hypothetical protein
MGIASNLFSKTVAKTAAESAAKTAAKTAAENAAKTAAKTAAENAAKAAAKQAAETAAKKAAKDAAETAAKVAAKDAAEVAARKAAKDAAETAAKKAAKNVGKQNTEKALKAAGTFVKNNPKLVVGTLTAATMAGVALTRFNEKDGKVLKIVKTEPKDKMTLITYDPILKFVLSDEVDISGTKLIDGVSIPVAKIVGNNQIIVDKNSDKSIFTGSMICRTSLEGQLTGVISDAAVNAVSVAGEVTGSVVAQVAESAGLSGLSGSSMFGNIKKYAIYALIIAIALMIIMRMISR